MIFYTKFGLIWTTPSPDEKELFLKFAKIRNSRNSQNSVWKTNFFLRPVIPKTFLFYTLITLVVLHTKFGFNWTTLWPDEIELFLKFAKVRISRNSKNSVWKLIFLLGQLYKKSFCFTLSLHGWYYRPSRVWFDLDNSLTRWKRITFKILKNSQFAKFANFPMKTQIFSYASYTKTSFCLTLSLHCWHSISRLVWFGELLSPMKKAYF